MGMSQCTNECRPVKTPAIALLLMDGEILNVHIQVVVHPKTNDALGSELACFHTVKARARFRFFLDRLALGSCSSSIHIEVLSPLTKEG